MKIDTYLNLPTPVLFLGAPGVGKTEKILDYFDYVHVMLLSSESEENIAGLPYRDGVYDLRTTPAMFAKLHEADKAGKSTCLFLDEIDKADRAVADTLLTLVASRQINGNKLPERTKIIAAANPPEYGGGDGLSIPMLNRMVVVDYHPDIAEWGSWALDRFKGEECAMIISKVLSGDIPILETAGDGLELRTTSPRSLTMALRCIEQVGSKSPALPNILRGLLCENAASKILVSFKEAEEEQYGLLLKTSHVVKQKKQAKKTRTRKPIEL